MDEKVNALKMLKDNNVDIRMTMTAYRLRYKEREDIVEVLPESLSLIIEHMFKRYDF